MDINNLKSTWKALHNKPEPTLATDQIHQLLKGKATDSISKIKRSILIEGGLTLVLGIFFALNKDWFYSSYTLLYLGIVVIICLGWYAFKYHKVSKIDLNQNLKQTLTDLISMLETYLKFYLYGSLMLGVFAGMLPFFWQNITFEDFNSMRIMWISLFVIIAFPLCYLFIKWYLKGLYGNYIQELKEELKELEELDK